VNDWRQPRTEPRRRRDDEKSLPLRQFLHSAPKSCFFCKQKERGARVKRTTLVSKTLYTLHHRFLLDKTDVDSGISDDLDAICGVDALQHHQCVHARSGDRLGTDLAWL